MKKWIVSALVLVPLVLVYLSMINNSFYLVDLYHSRESFVVPPALEKDMNVIQHDYPFLNENQVIINTSYFTFVVLKFNKQVKKIEKTHLLDNTQRK